MPIPAAARRWTTLRLERALRLRLGPGAAAALEREAPESLVLPLGSRRPIVYDEGDPYVAVRIQELFGLAASPPVCGKPLVFRLLSPANRPLQITRDLASFWRTTYPELRPAMRARYPKHKWPEDPTRPGRPAAAATVDGQAVGLDRSRALWNNRPLQARRGAARSMHDTSSATADQGGRGASLASLVMPVYMPAMLLSTGSAAMNTFLPLFLQQLGASIGLSAVVIGIGTAGVLVFDLPSGFVTARYGERRTLAVSGVVMVLGALLTAVSGSLVVAGLGIFLAHAAASFWFLGRLSFLRSALRVELRGRGLATAGGVMRIGQLIGPVAGGYLAEAAGFRWIFYGTAGLAAASLLCFSLFERGVQKVARRRGPGAARPGRAPTCRR